MTRGTVGGLICAVVASALLTLAACGDAETTSAPATGEPGGKAQLVDSQDHVPGGPAGALADIVTQKGDLPLVWERFQLEGDAPDVDWNTSALLFLGFGESGTCPARFDGVEVDGRNVRMHVGTEGGPDCTDDYHPRTFVVEVGRDQLPAGGSG